MRVNRNLYAGLALGTLMTVPFPAAAHHSTVSNPALYEAENLIELRGEIVEVHWRNPHVRFMATVTEGAEAGTEWELELGATGIMALSRAGIASDFVKPGDDVRIAGYRSRWSRSENSMGLMHLLLPNGQEYVDTNREARWVPTYSWP